MDGDGGEAIESRGRGAAGVDLPSILTRLDDPDPAEQRGAVRRIRTAIDDQGQGAVCAPTVPKLRTLLERPDGDFHGEVAACLADLAAEAPTDVAPSTGAIVTVARERADQPLTRELLRCLAAVAAERPDVVVEHVEAIADVLDRRRGYDHWGLRALAHVSREEPTAIEPVAPVLTDALAANPVENGEPALRALGRLARSEGELPSLELVAHAAALVDHDDRSLRHDAIGCLGDVAHRDPAAVEPVCADLEAALSFPEPDTRAVAAVTVARVAAEIDDAVDTVRGQLLELLADDQPHVRANACVALGHGGVDAAAPRLRELASEDPAPNVRDRASWAVRRLSTSQ
ncbi:HEAT repeat domain-containing protein [Natrinema amylolyticum]|uniref:HEAT repeat domain-containing protein n=1 Tax=Natrinema amylolyticum TaxID=2878679 RepID=UPI001CF95724|nr:HEAT repeat domain-containing protein [Natrinema amylolyticum]